MDTYRRPINPGPALFKNKQANSSGIRSLTTPTTFLFNKASEGKFDARATKQIHILLPTMSSSEDKHWCNKSGLSFRDNLMMITAKIFYMCLLNQLNIVFVSHENIYCTNQ